ncbi:MAG: hypothetical protein PWP23_588 [Candidatus Sumerlaeota bacterium]|nr:hypothetical protein [Candidatus Sumerlaeota bacterium]
MPEDCRVSPTKPIRLIVADVDGCITRGSYQPFDLEVLALIGENNRRSLSDPLVPALTFCTGRPLAYVQALQQACHCHHPAIAEFGAVMWDAETHTHAIHPAYTSEDRRLYEAILADAEQAFGTAGEKQVLIEAGKLCQLTLYPRPPMTAAILAEHAREFSERWSKYFATDVTTAVINYLPRAVNKGTAIEWLAGVVGLGLDEMAGLGDSASDWLFMEKCAVSAAPSNAVAPLLQKADWNLVGGAAECVAELYDRLLAYNRAALDNGIAATS